MRLCGCVRHSLYSDMLGCETRYFGTAEYAEADLIEFPCGLPGFPNALRFIVLQRPAEYPLAYLQSTAFPEVCFLALPILAIDSSYQLRLTMEDAIALGTPEDALIGRDVLCLALIAAHPTGPTANLLAPIVITLRDHKGAQCINTIGDYSHQHPLPLDESEVAA